MQKTFFVSSRRITQILALVHRCINTFNSVKVGRSRRGRLFLGDATIDVFGGNLYRVRLTFSRNKKMHYKADLFNWCNGELKSRSVTLCKRPMADHRKLLKECQRR